MEKPEFRPPKQHSKSKAVWITVCVLLVAAAGYWIWRSNLTDQGIHSLATSPAVVKAPEVAAQSDTLLLSEEVDTGEAADAIALSLPHSFDDLSAEGMQEMSAENFDQNAVNWLGQQALKFLVLPDLAHHVVATLDNLPRSHAPARLWPIAPTGGKLQIAETSQGITIAPNNSLRYSAVVDFFIGIEPRQLVAWYRQSSPLLQRTYEDLGYPGQFLHKRLVQVIDHLLQTPEPSGDLLLTLVNVQGDVPSLRPWVRYEFVDPQFQSLSAGQKIMLRLGEQQRQKIKVYLQSLRTQLVS